MAFSDKQSNQFHVLVALKLLIKEIQLHFCDLLCSHVLCSQVTHSLHVIGYFFCVKLLRWCLMWIQWFQAFSCSSR